MRFAFTLLIGLAALVLDPGWVFAQPGGPPPGGGGGWGGRGWGGRGGGGFRGGRGGGRMRMDPNQMWDSMSGGKNEIDINQVTDERRKGFLTRIAESAGVKDGKLTKDQFLKGMEAMRARWGGGGGGPPGQPAPGDGGAAPQAQPGAFDQEAEAEFKRLDKNGDGFLNSDEMPRRLRSQLAQWDTNKDGVIDLNEFKAYYADRMQRRMQRGGGNQPAPTPAEPVEKRPVVYRAGNLPKGIPAWFKELDTDGDGQIGLYEWRQSGRPIEEFLAMDRNKDGFLTIDEVMRYEEAKAAKGQDKGMLAKTPTGPGSPGGASFRGNAFRGGAFGGNNGGGIRFDPSRFGGNGNGGAQRGFRRGGGQDQGGG